MRFSTPDVKDQRSSLRELAKLIERNSSKPAVRAAALAITNDVDARDDLGELQAIYDAVKTGDSRVAGLKKGVRYVADPRAMDYFTGADALLKLCEDGACGGDCDDHTSLIASLCASLGFKVGARGWGPDKNSNGPLVHVYAVAAIPKRGPFTHVVPMDTTVPRSNMGWEPKSGHCVTAWID